MQNSSKKYDVSIDLVSYYGLVLSVKKYIRRANVHVSHNVALDMNVALKSIYSIQLRKDTDLYYNILVKNNVEPNCCSKWIAKLNCDISWKCCFQKVEKDLKNVKFKWLQIRIVHPCLLFVFLPICCPHENVRVVPSVRVV